MSTIKVMIEPSTDALVEEITARNSYLRGEEIAAIDLAVTEIRSLGYQIGRQVDVPMAVIEAIEESIAHPERNVRRERPRRNEE